MALCRADLLALAGFDVLKPNSRRNPSSFISKSLVPLPGSPRSLMHDGGTYTDLTFVPSDLVYALLRYPFLIILPREHRDGRLDFLVGIAEKYISINKNELMII